MNMKKNNSISLVHPDIQKRWNDLFEGGANDKKYPSLDLVRLERWHFGGVGAGKLLEYACGTGTNLIHLLKCGYEVEGIDASPNAILMVQKKLQSLSGLEEKTKLRVIDINADRLPYSDGVFDYVNCMNVLSLLASSERVSSLLREFDRVMKPGGKIILDINGPQADFAAKAIALPDDVYLYGEPPVPTYCPASTEDFSALIQSIFEVDDVGFTHHKYYGSEIQEFIICAHKLSK
jgi:SAM-dependent methyltransferase